MGHGRLDVIGQDCSGGHAYCVSRVAAQRLDPDAELLGGNGHNQSLDQFGSKFMAIN